MLKRNSALSKVKRGNETQPQNSPRIETIKERTFNFLETLSTRFPLPTILTACLLAACGGYLYFFELEVISDRSQLVNQELQANLSYQNYLQEFKNNHDLALVVCAQQSGANGLPVTPTASQRQNMKRIAQLWAAKLRARPDLFPKILERVDWSEAGNLSLLYLPRNKLQTATQIVDDMMPPLARWSANPSLTNLMAIASSELTRTAASLDTSAVATLLPVLEAGVSWVNTNLNAGASRRIQQAKVDFSESMFIQFGIDPDGYFFSENSKILTVLATVTGNPHARNQFAEPLEFAQASLDDILKTNSISEGLAAGLAGMPALEYEELITSERDFARTTTIALGCVTLLFVFGFGSLARPALATLCLALAIGITFAFVWLTIGHLNLLAMVFTVIIIALGVDFAIHFLTHYEHQVAHAVKPQTAIRGTYRSVGSPLVMGGITTAVAFFSAYFTEFSGLSELGLIAGSGLLICLLVMLTVYPALLYLLDTHASKLIKAVRERKTDRIWIPGVHSKKRKRATPKFAMGILIAVVAYGYIFGQHEFDTNLLNLQASDGNIARWQRLLFDVDDRTTFAISMFHDRESLEKARTAFEGNPNLVRGTESVYPAHEAEKRATIALIREQLEEVRIGNPQPVSLFQFKRKVWNLRQQIRKFQSTGSEAKVALSTVSGKLDSLYRRIGDLSATEATKRLERMDQELQSAAGTGLEQATDFLSPPSFSLATVPTALKDRFVGRDGSLALLVYPAQNTWDRHNLETFVEAARLVDPNIFGEIVALYENGRSLIGSFLSAAGYAITATFVLIFLWSKSVKATALSLFPLVTSVGLLLAFMKWEPNPTTWNFANFFAMPVLIGIGVDSGIHLVRAWQSGNLEIWRSAVKAVFFSSITTITGFGILATSHHVGIASLGYILFVGIGLCLLVSLTALPVALDLIDNQGAQVES